MVDFQRSRLRTMYLAVFEDNLVADRSHSLRTRTTFVGGRELPSVLAGPRGTP